MDKPFSNEKQVIKVVFADRTAALPPQLLTRSLPISIAEIAAATLAESHQPAAEPNSGHSAALHCPAARK